MEDTRQARGLTSIQQRVLPGLEPGSRFLHEPPRGKSTSLDEHPPPCGASQPVSACADGRRQWRHPRQEGHESYARMAGWGGGETKQDFSSPTPTLTIVITRFMRVIQQPRVGGAEDSLRGELPGASGTPLSSRTSEWESQISCSFHPLPNPPRKGEGAHRGCCSILSKILGAAPPPLRGRLGGG